ncbi:MAG TPA: CPBP family intramembrane glutamic endopeptidase [Verrucomicrobiae bacterium]|nr:CPBP family intramembrane glutamic endopeptidase [Verrucomicrobiae bacterium]
MLLAAAVPAAAHDEAAPEPSAARQMTPAMLWSLLPGGGHFYLGDTGTGLTYATLTGAFLLTGAEVSRRNDELGREDEVNVAAIIGEKVWEYSIFTTFRESASRAGIDLRANGFDDTPTASLLAAPFHYDQFTRPEVFGAALLGIAGAAISAHDKDGGRLIDVERARMFGSDFDRDDATALYGLSALGVSMGAGMSEEALFRGVLQPILQDRWGRTPGLWAASGVFGAAHIVGVDGEPNVGGVLFASAAGAYFGWMYNRDGNRLAGPIAAHFWYDFMLFAASWAMDPDDSAFGFDVDFQF